MDDELKQPLLTDEIYLPENEEPEDVAMGNEYLMSGSSERGVWTIEVFTKRCFKPRPVHVIDLHHHQHHQHHHHRRHQQ